MSIFHSCLTFHHVCGDTIYVKQEERKKTNAYIHKTPRYINIHKNILLYIKMVSVW